MSKVLLNIEENGIATLTLNYPEKRNILSSEVMTEIDNHINQLNSMGDQVKVLIIRSQFPAFFSAGGNVNEWYRYSKLEAYEEGLRGGEIFAKIENSHFITIASISGTCVGGGNELALTCDIRVSTEDAIFGQPEVLLGNGPSWGGYYRLSRKIGISKAKEWILLGENYSAKEAQACGYIHKVTSNLEELEEVTNQLARRLASNYQSVKVSKNILNQLEKDLLPTNTMIDALSASIFVENELSQIRQKAFLEKRLHEVTEP